MNRWLQNGVVSLLLEVWMECFDRFEVLNIASANTGKSEETGGYATSTGLWSIYKCMCVCVWGGAGGGSKGIQGRRKRLLVKQNSANNDSAGVNNTLQKDLYKSWVIYKS